MAAIMPKNTAIVAGPPLATVVAACARTQKPAATTRIAAPNTRKVVAACISLFPVFATVSPVEDAAFPALDIPAAPSASVSPTSSVAFFALRLKMFNPLTVVVSFLTSGSPMDLKSPFPVVFFMMALIAPNPIASSGSLGSILIILLRPLDTFSMTLRRALRAADVAFAVSLRISITPLFRLRVPANRSKEFAVFSSCFPVPLKIFDSPPIPLSATPINFVIPPMATSEIFCHAGANPADSVAVKPSAACPIVL